MSMKTTKNLLKFTDFHITTKKLFNYFSILTILFGSTFATFNSANAVNVTADTTISTETTADYDFATNASSTLTFNASGTLSGDNGAITDTVSGNVVITSAGDSSPAAGATTITFTSIDLDAGTIDGDITITDADDRTGAFTVVFDGAGTAGSADVISDKGDLVIQSLEDTDDEDMAVNVGGLVNIVAGTGTISAAGAGDVTLNAGTAGVAETITIAGGLTLAEAGAGKAVLNVKGTGAVTGAISGAAAGEGKIVVSGAGATFASILGGTELGLIDINNTATFNAAVTATTIEVVDAKVATFKDDITATSIALDATSNLTAAVASSAADTVITGTIDGIAANEGIITVNNTGQLTTFASAIGATNAIEDINVDENVVFNSTVSAKGGNVATGKSATFKGNTTIGTDELVIVGTVNISGTADQTITGLLNGDSNGAGKIDVVNTAGTVTFASALGATANDILAEIEASASSTVVFQNVIDTSLADVDGTVTMTMDDNTATNVTLAATGTIIIDDTITNGQKVFLTSTGVTNASLTAGGKIKLPANLSDGQTLELFEDVTNGHLAEIVVDTEAVLVDTALRTYTASSQTGDDIVVTVADRTATDAATQLGTTTNESTALLQATIAASTEAAALDAFSNGLNASGGYSATEDTALAKQVAPQTDLISGSSVAAQAVTGSVQGIMSSRMASLRSGDAYFGTGVAAGGMSAQSGFIQVFGSTAEQNNTTVGSGTQYGYESDTEGLAIGFDGVTDDGMTIGVSLATANTDVDGKGTGKSTNSIDTYSASLYMDRATDAGYIEGSVTYGLNENTSSRKVTSAGLDRTYTGSYDSQSLSLNISAGAPNEVGNGYLTPFGSFTASFMDIDAYTEKSTVANDALRLKVAQDDVNSMIGTLGIKYHAEMSNGGTPMISLAINNEFGDTTIDSTNTYQGGGTAFKTSTAVEELSATLGLGYSYGSDSTSIELAYEADVNDDDYLSHYGSIKLVGKF
jgi:uncharacterized protein with beta-barrel porin domain